MNFDPALLLRRLVREQAEFVIIGGVAASVYGSPVSTDDTDICAPLDRENACRIGRAISDLRPRWRFRPDLPIIQPDDSYFGQLNNMYFQTDGGILDVLGEVPSVCSYSEAVRESLKLEVFGLECRFLGIRHLIAAKRVANRAHDLRAIPYLEEAARRLDAASRSG